MRYVSPFALLGIDGTSQAVDRTVLQQTRKRLLAEFELAGNAATVNINGKEFTKSELLALLDGLQDAEILGFHQTIHGNAALLKFLLHDQLPQGGNLGAAPGHADKKFIAFLSPYFQFSYEQVLDVAFRKRDIRQLRNLNNMPLLVEPSAEEGCFRPVRRELQKIMSDIDTAVQGRWPYRFEPREVELMANTTLVQCIDELPARMQALRDDYASHLLDLALYVWNNCNHDQVAIRLLGQVENMKVGLEIKNRASLLRVKMRPQQQTPPPSFSYSPPKSESSGMSTGRAIFIVVKIIVLLAIVGRTCNRSSLSSKKSYDFEWMKNMPDYSKTLEAMERLKMTQAERNVAFVLGKFIKSEQLNPMDSVVTTNKKTRKKKLSRSLETGTMVYENCFRGKPLRLMQQVLLVNNSTKDAVFLVGADETAGFAVYVKAGDSYTDSAYLFNGVIMAYAGEDWNDTLSMGTHYFSSEMPAAEIIGGFTRPVGNSYSLLNDVITIDLLTETRLSSRAYSGEGEPGLVACRLFESEPGVLHLKRAIRKRQNSGSSGEEENPTPVGPDDTVNAPVEVVPEVSNQ
jgi:hypothetical protein